MHFSTLTTRHLAWLGVGCLLMLTSCGQPEPSKPIAPANFDRKELTRTVADIQQRAAATQGALRFQVGKLNEAVNTFLDAPSTDTLGALQGSWREAHIAYARAQFSFLAQAAEQRGLIYRIDAWPIQPGFIDNLPLYPDSGIIHDETLTLSADTLITQHGITDEEEVSLGFHAIEFLIFQRPLEDFALASEEIYVERRRRFLELAAAQLEMDIEQLLANSEGQFEANDYAAAREVLQQFLTSSLQKIRVAFRESNLVTTEDAGHSTFSGTSLETVSAEVEALRALMLEPESMGAVLKAIDANAYANLQATFSELQQLVIDGNEDEVSRANLPLLLSALTHQLESFDRMLVHRIPAS